MRTKLFNIIAIIAIIAIGIIACKDGDNNNNNETTHVHQWGEWAVTTAPTTTAEGVETRTCATCGEKETRAVDNDYLIVKERSTTINLFEGKTATVKGEFDKAGLDDVADKIKNALNSTFSEAPDFIKDSYRTVFNRGVTYIVETSPDGYINWKTIGDSKTVYFSFAKINDTNFNNLIIATVGSLYSNFAEIN